MTHIRTNDNVVILSGKDAGKTGRVLRVIHKSGRVLVEGINRVWKHVRPDRRNPQGGRIQKEAPLHVSNVMLVDPSSGKGTRARVEDRNGEKHRIAVRSGTDLGRIGRKVAKS